MRAAVSDVNFIGVRLRSYKPRELAIVNRELAMRMFKETLGINPECRLAHRYPSRRLSDREMRVFHLLGSGFGTNKDRAQQGSAGGRNSAAVLQTGGKLCAAQSVGLRN